MTMNEFRTLTNLEPTMEEFNQIHAEYIERATTEGIDKQQFCSELLQSIKLSKKESVKTMKELKEILKWHKKHYVEYVNGTYEYNELEEEYSFWVLDSDGELFSVYSGMDIEDLKRIKLTKIVYIAMQDDCQLVDTESGCLTSIYRNLDEERKGLDFIHFEKTVKRLQNELTQLKRVI